MSTNLRPIDVELQLEIDRIEAEASFQINPVVARNLAKRSIKYTKRNQQLHRQEKILKMQGWCNSPFERLLGGAK